MCIKCEMRDRAAAGDTQAEALLELIESNQVSDVMPVLVGEAMRQTGLRELTVDLDSISEVSEYAGMTVERRGNIVDVKLITPEEVPAAKASAELSRLPSERIN